MIFCQTIARPCDWGRKCSHKRTCQGYCDYVRGMYREKLKAKGKIDELRSVEAPSRAKD